MSLRHEEDNIKQQAPYIIVEKCRVCESCFTPCDCLVERMRRYGFTQGLLQGPARRTEELNAWDYFRETQLFARRERAEVLRLLPLPPELLPESAEREYSGLGQAVLNFMAMVQLALVAEEGQRVQATTGIPSGWDFDAVALLRNLRRVLGERFILEDRSAQTLAQVVKVLNARYPKEKP